MSVPDLMEKYPTQCRMLMEIGKTAQRNIDQRNRRRNRKRLILEPTDPDDIVLLP
jgi:hypothetical protein